jgi:hypothetical protein
VITSTIFGDEPARESATATVGNDGIRHEIARSIRIFFMGLSSKLKR